MNPSLPLLFLDVDGPLNPHRASNNQAKKNGYVTRRMNGHQVRLKRSHGTSLRELPYTLVWGTFWEHNANLWISPALGLPDLPVCGLPDYGVSPSGLLYKTAPIVEYANGRPFAWVDDELTDADHAWVADRHPGPALLHHVDPALGLAEDDFTLLAHWAATLKETR